MRQPGRIALLTAFGAVYLIWGSTYLGIRYAIETIPPLLMAGSRFVVAGAVFLLLGRTLGNEAPSRREWASAGMAGLLLIGIGNGGVTWAEQTVSSGVAALVASAVPMWMTLMDWMRPGGVRPSNATLCGVSLGMTGLFVLVGARPDGAVAGVSGSPTGMIVLIVASIGWALGSVVASHVELPRSRLTAIGAQMTAGGGTLLALGLISGEGTSFDPALITTRSMVAWAYLVVFGSWLGFSAYFWLLRNTTPAKASTYAFVNPLVAVVLGVWFAAEVLDARSVAAIAIILTGVALVVSGFGRRGPTPGGQASHLPVASSGYTDVRT